MIEFRNVEKRYPDGTLAVERLNLEIPFGKTTVFVGPSGCGKTTSLRMINRMIAPSSGQIMIDGTDAAQINTGELRRSIGYVIQNAGLFPHRTVLQNIMTVPRLNGVPKAQAAERARLLMHTVGLDESFANKFPTQLSGGQQQRVGVARALAAEPSVLLMDEPFSALDPIVRTELQDEFMRLGAELGTTIVFVTHDIDEAVKVGDRIAVFAKGGQLAQFDTPAKILTQPANQFVADFVGRDRGYRGLSFAGDAALVATPVTSVRVDDAPTPGNPRDWVVLCDAADRTLGWMRREDPPRFESAYGSAAVYRNGDSMRVILDAVLMSPSGRAVHVDEARRPLGSVGIEELVAAGLTRAHA
ncbi:ABC transporter ATP-binding protein [Leucobacter luti]|uniref:ABC-type quaternary amine transporter n=1 Tax=Leucobacter luti TaxID=340320 RepID=A0A4R6S1T7_9MICO|nr:ATP-binding cassette domain-containing protein [Leucobacter luti]QYM76324.1 ATP-binding cassette domain-containing protein [Leucobacter luti]TDP92606.1 osmoprotectant transport system ATP-binding protein [Leucobacter luti]